MLGKNIKPIQNITKTKMKSIQQKQIQPDKHKKLKSQLKIINDQEIDPNDSKILKKGAKINKNPSKETFLLDVDQFLQKQREKRRQYAKQLNSEFEKKKLQRQRLLYDKHNRKARQKNDNNSNNSNIKAIQNKRYVKEAPQIIYKLPQKDQRLINQYYILSTHALHSLNQFLDTNLDNQILRKQQKQIFQILQERKKLDENEEGQKFIQKSIKQINWLSIKSLASDSSKLCFWNYQIVKQKSLKNTQQLRVIVKNDIILANPDDLNILNVLLLITVGNIQFMQNKIIYKGDELLLKQQKLKQIYGFRLFDKGLRKTVFTDLFIKTISLQKQNSNLQNHHIHQQSHCVNTNRCWITLFIKSYKKLKAIPSKKFKFLSLNQISKDFGLELQIIKFNRQAIIKQNFFKVIQLLLKNGTPIGFVRFGKMEKSRAQQDRIYPIRKVHQIIGKQKIQIVNPWKGKILKQDGFDYFSLDQILIYFNRIVILKDYGRQWIGIRFDSFFYSFGMPNQNNNEWTKHNQHLFNVTKPAYFKIVLRNYESPLQNHYIYGFLLFKTEAQQTKITCMKLQKLLIHSKSVHANEASVLINLKIGNYILIPYSSERSYNSYRFFWFQFYTNVSNSFTFGRTKYTDVKYKNINDQNTQLSQLVQTQKYQKLKTISILQQNELRSLADNSKLTDQIKNNKLHLQQNIPRESILYPGGIHKFLVLDHVVIKQQSTIENNSIDKREQLIFNQHNQILKYLIGADCYTQQVKRDAFQSAIEHLQQNIDLSGYGLTDQSFIPVLQAILQSYNRILTLNLSNNCLSQKSVIRLCYEIEKSRHTQLRVLDLRNQSQPDDQIQLKKKNKKSLQIGETGIKALIGLKKRMKMTRQIRVDGINKETKQIFYENNNQEFEQ